MSLTGRRVVLWFLSALAAVIGVWSMVFPLEWYETFPDGSATWGFGPWIRLDGPFNEHLIRDVGAMYLALAGAGTVAALSRSLTAARAVAVAWIVFSAPHLVYHLGHLHGLATLDAVAEPISLALTLVLPIPLLFGAWAKADAQAAPPTTSGCA
ncbi:hypothetical protein SCB71_19380 [Herbiconiux sp. KACC 21604]|uniref:hypothetical protein n=1 Tax=unclassified Herbiconiux TaxID=2618217 RepID=UPI00149240ED|nr:hypothetical protein [Herbiconiux sp. SALV-R1]QJU55196.1 hypothetical protein HL652_17315 [Herbiconiux sp. SALV-R1]WPO86360.1 hypothetical protein SCB71_19380 [Herbiconiux sp. KACC 21604]